MNRDTQQKTFDFGENWKNFIVHVDEKAVERALQSLKNGLKVESLQGKTFLDVGCGSGLFSLAATKLNADAVYSFDYSAKSVEATKALKNRYYPDNSHWIITQGSILDDGFVRHLGSFDIVYAWGVLHHTGNMWQALKEVIPLVREKGQLYIAIYNDQGRTSALWRFIKIVYNHLPGFFKKIYILMFMLLFELKYALCALLSVKSPFYRLREADNRGMNIYHDWVDWLGGYPFEVAKPDEMFDFFHKAGFQLEYLKTVGGGLGNNEYVFRKTG